MSGKRDYNKDIYKNGLYSDELNDALKRLQSTDVEAFTNLILSTLRFNEDQAVADGAPVKNKLRALNKMQEYLITTERYEDCAFVKNLIERITDAE